MPRLVHTAEAPLGLKPAVFKGNGVSPTPRGLRRGLANAVEVDRSCRQAGLSFQSRPADAVEKHRWENVIEDAPRIY